MLKDLPVLISFLFGTTVLAAVIWFYIASRSRTFLIMAACWIVIQSLLALKGVYEITDTLPPRLFVFGVLPALVTITFLTARGKTFIDSINLKTLTAFHAVRIPVEIVLVLLCHQGLVSPHMTMEGTNFDIFSGITAPIVALMAFRGGTVNRKLLLVWNIICVLLLFNVVITAILSLPSPMQQISFDQPNVAVLYFPFNLLPALVVPLVLFAHLVAFRRLRLLTSEK